MRELRETAEVHLDRHHEDEAGAGDGGWSGQLQLVLKRERLYFINKRSSV